MLTLGSTRPIAACIVCGSDDLTPFLDLGSTPLANRFLTREELEIPEPVYPLRVALCANCFHVQLSEIVAPMEMFEDYLYVSSASDTLRAHLFDLSAIMSDRRGLTRDDLVMDIGCNDGALLEGFQRFGVRTLGVDPAKNLAELARGSGIERYVDLFDSRSADEIVDRWGRAALITATNTFPHIPDLHDFLEGIEKALEPGGAFVVEAHYLLDMIEQVAFDTIYHEHVSYWSLGPMMRLLEQHGFQVVDAERVPLHHGQLRVTMQRKGERDPDARVDRILAAEQQRGLRSMRTFESFAERTANVKRALSEMLEARRNAGLHVVGYGAPAKGNTLLSYLEIGPDKIGYIVDRSPLKQGRFTPGSHIPIVPVERLLQDQPDAVVLFAWNFVDEIVQQEAEYHRRGGRFIVPIPAPFELTHDDIEAVSAR